MGYFRNMVVFLLPERLFILGMTGLAALGIFGIASLSEVFLGGDSEDELLVAFRADQKLRFETVSH